VHPGIEAAQAGISRSTQTEKLFPIMSTFSVLA
jgi:hypothetical protein